MNGGATPRKNTQKRWREQSRQPKRRGQSLSDADPLHCQASTINLSHQTGQERTLIQIMPALGTCSFDAKARTHKKVAS